MRNIQASGLPRWWLRIGCAAVVALFACRPAAAQHQHGAGEFDIFLSAEGVTGHGQPNPREDDTWLNADVVFGLKRDQFRVFGEYFITTEENDLERFQLGYEVVPDTVVWLGRFHQPASAWDTEHHHGRYLQTAITRPAIENWEDEDGLIPQHITGTLLESRWPILSETGIQFDAGAGVGPALTPDDNKPFSLIRRNPGHHGISFMGRLAYLPDYVGTSSAGLLFGHDQLFANPQVAASLLRSNHVLLNIYGAYADWSVDDWRIIGTFYHIEVGLDHPTPDENFSSAYLQLERRLPHQLTAFARVEDSPGMHRSRYVNQLDGRSSDIDIAIRRQTGGLRWDFGSWQALTIEVGHEIALAQRGNEVRLQWSAVLP